MTRTLGAATKKSYKTNLVILAEPSLNVVETYRRMVEIDDDVSIPITKIHRVGEHLTAIIKFVEIRNKLIKTNKETKIRSLSDYVHHRQFNEEIKNFIFP